MSNEQIEVQTRSEDGGLKFFASLNDAMDYANSDKTVWKVSFSVGEDRVRLVKEGDSWVYRPLKL